MMKGLSESGSQRVSIMGSDMLLQPEWSMEEMSKLTSFSHLVNGKLKRRARAAGCCRGEGGEGGGGGVRSRRRRALCCSAAFYKSQNRNPGVFPDYPSYFLNYLFRGTSKGGGVKVQ